MFAALVVASIVVTYICWLQPLLKTRPSLAQFWTDEASFFTALHAKFDGIKQQLTTVFVTVAGGVVLLHDELTPYLSGIDTTQITSFVPQWAWPVIMIGLTLFVQWLRGFSVPKVDTTN